MGQLLFETGHWDDALAEMEILPENLKDPDVACMNLGLAAVISFHRGEVDAARRYLAAAVPFDERVGHRLIRELALARSLDHEQAGELPEALAALTAGSADTAADLLPGRRRPRNAGAARAVPEGAHRASAGTGCRRSGAAAAANPLQS